MFKYKSIISLALALSLSATTAISSFAMTTDEIIAGWSGVVNLSIDPLNGNYLKIAGTEGTDINDAETKLNKVAWSLGVIKDFDFQAGLWDRGSNSYATIDQKNAENGLDKFNFCVDWLKNNMPLICPTGTDMNEVIPRCAQWLADTLTYDHAAVAANDSAKYQSAYTAFDGTGLGVCATYSAAFVAMVSYVPIETGTSYVNWDAENVWYFETGQYQNPGVHQWSAVKDPVTQQWHQYDITGYDSDINGVTHNEFMNMAQSYMEKFDCYDNEEFYPNISLRPTSLNR